MNNQPLNITELTNEKLQELASKVYTQIGQLQTQVTQQTLFALEISRVFNEREQANQPTAGDINLPKLKKLNIPKQSNEIKGTFGWEKEKEKK